MAGFGSDILGKGKKALQVFFGRVSDKKYLDVFGTLIKVINLFKMTKFKRDNYDQTWDFRLFSIFFPYQVQTNLAQSEVQVIWTCSPAEPRGKPLLVNGWGLVMTVMRCYNSSKIRLRPHQSGLDFEDYMGVAVAFPQKFGAQS